MSAGKDFSCLLANNTKIKISSSTGRNRRMKKNMKLFIVLKVEYGAGEENAFSEVLQITSSKSTAETFKAHYEEQFADEIHNAHNKRWVSIRMHQALIQIDDEIVAPDWFIRFLDGKTLKEHF
jgi:hypothetical protein